MSFLVDKGKKKKCSPSRIVFPCGRGRRKMRSSLGLLVDISITMYMEELETKLDAGTV